MIWIPKKISFNKKDLKIVLYNIKIILIYEYIKIFINFMYYIWEIQIGKVIQKWSKISIINLKGSLKSINYEFPNNDYIKGLPLCNCGLPCDVKKNINKNRLYFRCAKHSIRQVLCAYIYL